MLNQSTAVLLLGLVVCALSLSVFCGWVYVPHALATGQGLAFAAIALIGFGGRLRRQNGVSTGLPEPYRKVLSTPLAINIVIGMLALFTVCLLIFNR